MLSRTKMALAAVVLAGSMSTALADEAFDVDLYHANPNAATQFHQPQYAAAASSYAQAGPRVRSTPVYENGKYIGRDPDANVRLQLRRDFDFE
jgi:hypothetical protein